MSLTKVTYSMVKNAPANVLDFGNNSAAFQEAIAASSIVILPPGDFFVDAQITVPANKTIIIRGVLKPAHNSVASGTAMLNITGSNVTIEFQNGGINGIDSTYKNWGGIAAGYQTVRLNNIHVRNGYFENLALTSTDAFAITYGSVSESSMIGNTVKNCGTTTSIGGGFGLYMQYCNQCVIDNNVIDTVGATGINDSCGADNIITNNTLRYISLFGMKGGYGSNSAVTTADVTPTQFTFSIDASNSTRQNFVPGVACTFLNASTPLPIAYISAVVDNGTYLQCFVSKTMIAAPDIGVQVQMLSKGTIFSNNTVTQTGDNGWDYNGWCEITCIGNVLNECGAYTGAGLYGGLKAGFWFGYDPQGSYNNFRSEGLNITSNYMNNTQGSGISVMATADDLHIEGNMVINSNRANDVTWAGIDVTRLAFYRSARHSILNNTVINYGTGVGINASYSSGDFVSGNHVSGHNGITLNSQNSVTVANNMVTFSNNSGSGYGVLVSDDSTFNTSSEIQVNNNTIYGPASGFGIRNIDTNYSLIDVFANNTIKGSGSFVAFSNNGADIASSVSASNPAFTERHVTQFLTGQAITFSRVVAATANAYLLSVQSEQNPTTGLSGLYLISRSTSQAQITTLTACADVSVTFNGSYQVVVTNTTGSSRTLAAALSVMM